MKLAASALVLIPALAGADVFTNPLAREFLYGPQPQYQPQMVIPVIPGTNFRDYTQPGYRIESNGYVYPTVPGTNYRDYSRPSYQIRPERIW